MANSGFAAFMRPWDGTETNRIRIYPTAKMNADYLATATMQNANGA